MLISPGKLLSNINSPQDLKKLDQVQLVELCEELRQFIIDNVSVYGGHFGASLGVVELTVALHYVFNTPTDQLVWDVGHQAYGHKILTGRKEEFHTNRMYGGISGFPKRSESEYDTFGVGHSSTSVSAGLGMAAASKYLGLDQKQHIAVIGDGALTGGMAFEALNHAGVSDTNLLIILNDNCMSIDPNVGALKDYLTDITTSKTYNRLKDDVWNLLGKLSHFGKNAQEVVSKVENGIKATLLSQSNLFESLNLRYFGPVDGHDVDHLVAILRDLQEIKGPKILPEISSRRTVPSTAVAILLTIILAYAMRHLLPDRADKYWLAAGVIASFGGLIGDLVMSVMRKDAGVKIVGQFILGRGDFLQRMDRLIFVAPIYYFVMLALKTVNQ